MDYLICPFIAKRCIEHKCMMWVKVNIVKDSQPDTISTCCIPLQLKSSLEIQNELIRTQSNLDKLNNTLAETGGRISYFVGRSLNASKDQISTSKAIPSTQ